MSDGADFWTDDTSVLFTSYYGWTPETWACVNWSDEKGRSRRDNLLRELTDPFITVCYVTGNSSYFDPAAKGLITGFLLVTHEPGDRDEFTHPIHHDFEPAKWRHSLRAIRAFGYVPEHRLRAVEFMPELSQGGQAVATWGKVLDDRQQIKRLRTIPWREVEVYSPGDKTDRQLIERMSERGWVQAGPSASQDYLVSPSAASLPCQLYVLRLEGAPDAYLGKPAGGRFIYKLGVSRSPELRRQAFQKAMPRGVFRWTTERTTGDAEGVTGFGFAAAVAGEYAMKRSLSAAAEHLGGEFYLATPAQIDDAWRAGHDAAASFVGDSAANG